MAASALSAAAAMTMAAWDSARTRFAVAACRRKVGSTIARPLFSR
jgi:hypothetical protein